jgi:simple sugar transport system ATP-binding protein
LAADDRKGGAAAPSFADAPPALDVRGVNKHFGPVHANRNIDLTVAAGSIHGIVGENGAGKSTLMNILYGMYAADSGEIWVDGEKAAIGSSADAIAHGIGMVHQHFMLVRPFTVLENVMLGAEKDFTLTESVSATRALIQRMETDYGLTVDPDAKVEDLAVGLQQRVEIIKALRGGQRILILDEPTGVLTPQETEGLFAILRALRDEGTTVLLITHKLHEIMALTDRVSVMRRGEMVAHRDTADTSTEELAELMVGRKVLLKVDRPRVAPGAPVLTVKDLRYRDPDGVERVKGLNFEIREGELLAVAGVSGNGQSELLDLLAGIRAPSAGEIRIGDKVIDAAHPRGPAGMRRLGVSHVPEDRHHRGLVLPFDARENSILGFHEGREAGDGVALDLQKIAERADRHVEEFDVRPPVSTLRASQYSGGNQQKLVLAREIDADPRLLLVGQPTRGVDVGAIEFIFSRLMDMKKAGCAILLVSVELEEVMSLSDRILVMSNGEQTGMVDRADADERSLGLMMAGVEEQRHPLGEAL